MKTRRTVWANGLLFAALLASTAVGCGSDDDDDGSGGAGGTAGKGGSAGAGKGGSAGTAGTAGKGGTGGSAGKGGSAGSAGSNAGNGGSSGSTSGAAGTGEAGDAGAAGITGGGGSGGESGGAGGEGGSSDGGTQAGGAGGDAAGAGGVGESGAGGASGGAGGEPSVEPSCEAYCDVIQDTCNGVNAQYPSEAQCLATCAVFPTVGNTGNTLGCRLDHANLAASSGVDPHCDHAGPAGIGMCGSNCAGYCTLMMNICSGTFATEEECMNTCASVPEATFTNFVYPAPGGDTLQCRIAHATNAAASEGAARTSHCTHAAGAAPCN